MSELAAKMKTYKKQIEEAEVIAALNPAKFCKVEVEVEFRSGRTLQFYLAMNDNVNYGYSQCENYEY